LGEISPHEFAPFISADMQISPVMIHNLGEVTQCLDFFMGRNTPDRKQFIIDNLATEVI
jgi:DNA gyrase/topoisomerase IV subunit B